MKLVERAEMLVNAGMEEQFAAMMRDKGLPLISAVPGAINVSLGQGLENPEKFMLLVEWETMDAHKAFARMPEFTTFRELLSPFTRGGAMEHFNII